MTLGRLLAEIAETKNGEERESLKKEFLSRAKGHREEKLLMECFNAAYHGKTFIDFYCGRNILPPAELRHEGFYLKKDGIRYNYCFQ